MKLKFLSFLLCCSQAYIFAATPVLPVRSEGESPELTEPKVSRPRTYLNEKKRQSINIGHIQEELTKLVTAHNQNNPPEKHLIKSTGRTPYVFTFNNKNEDLEFLLLVQYQPGIPDIIFITLWFIDPTTLEQKEYNVTCTFKDLNISVLELLNIISNL